MQLARERYPTANPVPRRLRKKAIRNLGMIDKAAKTGDWGEVKEALRQRHPAEDHQQTQTSTARAIDQSKIQEIISDGPERIGATIDACSEDPNRRHFAQALLDTALEPYFLLQLAMFANKKVNAHVTIKKWRDAGLKLPAEGTPEFFPYGD